MTEFENLCKFLKIMHIVQNLQMQTGSKVRKWKDTYWTHIEVASGGGGAKQNWGWG